MAVIVALGGTIDIVRSGIEGLRVMRGPDWACLTGALAVCILLAGHLWYPWGLALVYSIAGWRQGLWMPEPNPVYAL